MTASGTSSLGAKPVTTREVLELRRNFDAKSCLAASLSAIDEANSSVAGCYSAASYFGQANYEYPSLDDSVTYANMYDTLLRNNPQNRYPANYENYEPTSPGTPVYDGHFAPKASKGSCDSSQHSKRKNSAPNRKSKRLAQLQP